MKIKQVFLGLSFILVLLSCTNDFNEINEKPDALTADDVSAKFFVTNLQVNLFAPNRFPYWRGPLIHADRFAGQHAFGYSNNWWDDGLAYKYHAGYTNAVFGWMSGFNSTLTAFTNFVKEDGTLANDQYYAISLIMKGLYYQLFTDTFGMIPFSEASNPDIVTPVFDTQKDIYKGIISDLDQAIGLIGNNQRTGTGVNLLQENDLFFDGDLQSWKNLANSLKLRLALRANGAEGDDFSNSAINEAISNGLLLNENALLSRDTEISQWASAVYGDIWHNFYGGGHWNLAATMVDILRNNDDPRLNKYAKPSAGGTIKMNKPTEGENAALFDKHTEFIFNLLDNSGAVYSKTVTAEGVSIEMEENTNYVGFPTRVNAKIKPYLDTNLFAKPADIVVNKKNEGKPIFPYVVMTAAESHFMIAEAIIKGLSEGDAQSHYQKGIESAMKLWEVDDVDIMNFMSTQDISLLNGSTESNLEKVAIQRWLLNYTNGFEAWSIVRDMGYPKTLFDGVSDPEIFELGELNGAYPQRMRYGSATYNTNGANTEAANSIQGPDVQATKLWWAKK